MATRVVIPLLLSLFHLLTLIIQSDAFFKNNILRSWDEMDGLERGEKKKRLVEELMELPGTIEDLSEAYEKFDELLKIPGKLGDVIPDSLIPDKLKFLKCKKLGNKCDGMPRCCGDTQCYWERGFSLLKDGICVTCVNETQFCQRDANCCEGMMCDRGSSPLFNVDGTCQRPRTAGDECYRNKQCRSLDCKKRWWQISGTCTKAKKRKPKPKPKPTEPPEEEEYEYEYDYEEE